MCSWNLLSVEVFHEEIALQWIFASGGSTKNMVLKNSWFFFEMIVCFDADWLLSCYSAFLCVDQEHGTAPQQA